MRTHLFSCLGLACLLLAGCSRLADFGNGNGDPAPVKPVDPGASVDPATPPDSEPDVVEVEVEEPRPGTPPPAISDDSVTPAFIRAGGSARSEAAVALGLEWLHKQQHPDGRWSFKNFITDSEGCVCTHPASLKDSGQEDGDVAATALALLPFVAHGETHLGSDDIHRYTKTVDRGLKWLLSQQKEDGSFGKFGTLYPQAMASLAICELYGISRDPAIRDNCQQAINFIVKAQYPDGGWRYQVGNQPGGGDMSVTSWMAQTLKSGQLSGLDVPYEALDKLVDFLSSVSTPAGDGFKYQPRDEVSSSMTACGMLTRQYLVGGDLTSGPTTHGAERLMADAPSFRTFRIYYYYYATQVMFNIQGPQWEEWNKKMRDLLISTQDKGTAAGKECQKGSWSPTLADQRDKWDRRGGRLMVTCLALLTLEVYYRHTPLNGPLGIMWKDGDKTVEEMEQRKKEFEAKFRDRLNRRKKK